MSLAILVCAQRPAFGWVLVTDDFQGNSEHRGHFGRPKFITFPDSRALAFVGSDALARLVCARLPQHKRLDPFAVAEVVRTVCAEYDMSQGASAFIYATSDTAALIDYRGGLHITHPGRSYLVAGADQEIARGVLEYLTFGRELTLSEAQSVAHVAMGTCVRVGMNTLPRHGGGFWEASSAELKA